MRKAEDPLWDDEAFLGRIKLFAKMQDLSTEDAIKKAGMSPTLYLEQHPFGRNIEGILRLAETLNIHPCYLLFEVTDC